KRTAFKRFGNGNGCGTDLIAPLLNPFVHQYEQCCNKHDQCYESCSKTKNECDLIFLQCLESVQKGAFVVMARGALKGHYACDAYMHIESYF
ncbi:group XIIA secretory phospholipase A2-like protein, partial [Leptotrombidium deliense]